MEKGHLPEGMTLDDDTFYHLRDIIYRESGIFIQEQKKYLLETRLVKRLKTLKLDSFQEYLRHLKNGNFNAQEYRHLLDAITINETSFFRNAPQLQAFESVVFPELVNLARERRQRQIRILSAGCSSGEEPYTLAMILHRRFLSILQEFQLEIVGFDISQEVLQNALRGEYSQFSIRNVPEEYFSNYFVRNGNRFLLKEEIKNKVKFYRANLMDGVQLKRMGIFDLIFCRNVLIYFDKESKKKAIQNLYHILHPKGYLFIGHSESLHGVSHAFKLVLFNKAIAYKKE